MITNSIKEIVLNNFRNYDNKIINFFNDFNVIIAPNGYGKTNLIEAISIFSDLKGLRKASIEDLVNLNNKNRNSELLFSIMLKFFDGNKLTLLQKEDKKNIIFNDENIKKSNFLNNILKITWLTPQMDDFFIGPSKNRRTFIDKTANLLFIDHYENVKKYEFFIKERLKILQLKNLKWLEIIEKKIVNLGVSISYVRNETINYLNEIFINNTNFFPTGIISINGIIENMLIKNKSLDVENFYLNKLKENRNIDNESRRTNFGVHKSDILVFNKFKNMIANLCSNGEQKMLLISLIIIRSIFSKQINKGIPILLLDEVCSHIDNEAKNNLFKELKKIGIQTFITGIYKDNFKNLTSNFIEL